MAFQKRTWLARIGQGLNKFIIGEKDANGKQTLTNAPDEVTQQGDVISAENLNDLEERIETSVNANETAINGMKLTKIWENPNPTSGFTAQSIDLGELVTEIVIEYVQQWNGSASTFQHCRATKDDSNLHVGFEPTLCFSHVFIPLIGSDSYLSVNSRRFNIFTGNNTSIVSFTTCSETKIKTTSVEETVNNYNLIPIAIYKVGDIYNS